MCTGEHTMHKSASTSTLQHTYGKACQTSHMKKSVSCSALVDMASAVMMVSTVKAPIHQSLVCLAQAPPIKDGDVQATKNVMLCLMTPPDCVQENEVCLENRVGRRRLNEHVE
jgi:hypothetical protein